MTTIASYSILRQKTVICPDVVETYGDLSSDNVYAYPNPVEPEFTGNVTIMGLTHGCQITITTPSGYVVNKGTCSGGMYQWNCCDMGGRRVASGVYNVLVATKEGEWLCDKDCCNKINDNQER